MISTTSQPAGHASRRRRAHRPTHRSRCRSPIITHQDQQSRERTRIMGYFIGVILQTVVLPIVSGTIELAATGGNNPVEVYGRWWVFWGVGTRLLVAGIVQLVRPETTAEILGTKQPTESEQQVARELSTANLGMGLAGLLALNAAWAAPAGVAGGVFLLIAGLMHVRKKNKNAQETLATWTDLIVGVAALVFATYTGVSAFS